MGVCTKDNSCETWEYWAACSRTRHREANRACTHTWRFLASPWRCLWWQWILAISCLLFICLSPFTLRSKYPTSVCPSAYKRSGPTVPLLVRTLTFSTPLPSWALNLSFFPLLVVLKLSLPTQHVPNSQGATTNVLPKALLICPKPNTTSLPSSEIKKDGLQTTDTFFRRYRNLKGDSKAGMLCETCKGGLLWNRSYEQVQQCLASAIFLDYL